MLLLGPALAWLLVRHRQGWTSAEVTATVSLTASLCAALASLLDRRIGSGSGSGSAPDAGAGASAGHTLSLMQLEEWRVRLRAAVIEARVDQGGQLDQMIRYGEALDLSVTMTGVPAPGTPDSGESSVRRLSEISCEWGEAPGRLVILGEPGYGKTVAALTLTAHLNTQERPGGVVAEIFSLLDWHHWHIENPSGLFHSWLAEQLSLTYPRDLPRQVSQQLIAEELVLPILDGLDEIPTAPERRACVDAIDGYTRRIAPHRPFVLTCRAEEYAALAPDWVGAERHVALLGLQPEQVDAILQERTAGRASWNAIRQRQGADDQALHDLLRSPLRLAVALEAYRDRDPSELVDLSPAEARRHLWDLLLSSTASTLQHTTEAHAVRWLRFLATGMRRTGRQRLMLHEIHLLDPTPAKTRWWFALAAGIVTGAAIGLLVGVAAGWDIGLLTGPLLGLTLAVFGTVEVYAPSIRERVGLGVRMRHALTGLHFLISVLAALICGVIFTALTRPVAGLIVGLVVLPYLILYDIVDAGRVAVSADPPARFALGHPDALLLASRNSGLSFGLCFGVVYALGIGVPVWLIAGPIEGVRCALGFGLATAVGFGFLGGLNAWLFHYWLRWWLSVRGLLPRRLTQFLDSCAQPSRRLLRVTNAYEFRHRELLEHLALERSSEP